MCWRLKLDALEVDFDSDCSQRYVESLVVLREHNESLVVHYLVSFLCSSFLAMAREAAPLLCCKGSTGPRGFAEPWELLGS